VFDGIAPIGDHRITVINHGKKNRIYYRNYYHNNHNNCAYFTVISKEPRAMFQSVINAVKAVVNTVHDKLRTPSINTAVINYGASILLP